MAREFSLERTRNIGIMAHIDAGIWNQSVVPYPVLTVAS